jgi:hypothetical protein
MMYGRSMQTSLSRFIWKSTQSSMLKIHVAQIFLENLGQDVCYAFLGIIDSASNNGHQWSLFLIGPSVCMCQVNSPVSLTAY